MATVGRRLTALLLCAVLLSTYACSKKGTATSPDPAWPAPTPVTFTTLVFPPMPIPAGNPTTAEGIALGRRLFYDPILSSDSTQSCASCHQFGRSFSDSLPFSLGVLGNPGPRNSPSIINPGWLPTAFWDGRAASLEDQARQPVANPNEMNSNWLDVIAKIQRHAAYPDMFGRAFGTSEITQDLTVKAIAQFERSMISRNSRYDRWRRNEVALSPMEDAGRKLFFTERADCFHCHSVDLTTTNEFRNNGADATNLEPGRMAVTGDAADFGKFKVPTLRNIAHTGPYMHNSRYATLREAVEHYNNGVSGITNLDPLVRPSGVGLGMRPGEVDTLIAFILTFTDSTFANDTSLASPF